jgi:rhamnose transport system substrate-binding protein
MKKSIVILLVLGAFVLALVACGGQAQQAVEEAAPTVAAAVEEAAPTVEAAVEEAATAVEEASEETADEAMEEPAEDMAEGGGNYVLVPKNLGNPYFDTANVGAQDAAGELGVEVTYQGSAVADATEQIQLLNSLIAQNVDGLAISANDADALVPTGQEAMDAGIPVVTWDSAIAEGGRNVHVVQAESDGIAEVQLQMASDLAGGEGEIAILSATSTAPNQNEWIALMEEKLPDYPGLNLVATVYGDDEDEKSYNEAIGLMQTYPDLKVIIAPTTVGIAASARAVQDAGRVGEVFVTGLGTPNQMREYVESGASPQFALWNPADLGYLAIYTLNAIASGEIAGEPGDSFEAGMLGSYTIRDDGTVLLGPPTVFDENNINDFDF